MVETQTHIEHNTDTRQNRKVLCLHPVKVVNPRIVEFILTHDNTFFFDKKFNRCEFVEPHLKNNWSTKEYKQILMRRVRKLLHHDETIEVFFDNEGECVDAYIYVPCNHCIVCLHRKAVNFSVKCSMECQQHDRLPLFITLTYSDENLPPFGLRYRDVQNFLKRLRIRLERKHGFSGKLRYAGCGEYGSHTGRPHYHLLIWDFPRTGEFANFFKIDSFIRDTWKLGLTQTKQCRDGKAGQYVGKYLAKQDVIPNNLVKPMKRTSKCLGLDFVSSVCRETLLINPSQVKFQYHDKFDNKVCDLPLTSYYLNKMFPRFMSLSVDVRNAIRDYSTGYDLNDTKFLVKWCQDNYLLKINPYKTNRYMDTLMPSNCAKLDEAIFILSQHADEVLPDYLVNEKVLSEHYAILFSNFDDVDVVELGYNLEKRRAIARDKEVF